MEILIQTLDALRTSDSLPSSHLCLKSALRLVELNLLEKTNELFGHATTQAKAKRLLSNPDTLDSEDRLYWQNVVDTYPMYVSLLSQEIDDYKSAKCILTKSLQSLPELKSENSIESIQLEFNQTLEKFLLENKNDNAS